MVFSLAACGGDEKAKDSSVIELDGSTLEYIGSELGKDTDGNDAVLLHYNFTNGANEAKRFFWTFFYNAKQGDTELEEAINWFDEDSFVTHTDASFEDVEPGASKKVTISFNIIDKTTPIVVTFTDLMDEVLGETTVDSANLRESSGGSWSVALRDEKETYGW